MKEAKFGDILFRVESKENWTFNSIGGPNA
jgi:hypothetical protein